MPATSILGRTRSGRPTWPAALLIGLPISAAVSATGYLIHHPDPWAWLLAVLLLATTLPITAALGWALVVDRDSLRGATPRPEESVESTWLRDAGFGACFDLLAVAGLATGAFSLVPALATVPAWVAMGALTLLGMADVWIRYLALSRRAA